MRWSLVGGGLFLSNCSLVCFLTRDHGVCVCALGRSNLPPRTRDLIFFFSNPEPRCRLFRIGYGPLHLLCTYLQYHVVVITGQHEDPTTDYLALVPDWLTDTKQKSQFMSWWASTKFHWFLEKGRLIYRHCWQWLSKLGRFLIRPHHTASTLSSHRVIRATS